MITLTKSILKKIENLAYGNHHGLAQLELAKLVKNTRYIKICKAINTIHDQEGSIPDDIYQYRYKIFTYLMAQAETMLSPDDFKKLNRSF